MLTALSLAAQVASSTASKTESKQPQEPEGKPKLSEKPTETAKPKDSEKKTDAPNPEIKKETITVRTLTLQDTKPGEPKSKNSDSSKPSEGTLKKKEASPTQSKPTKKSPSPVKKTPEKAMANQVKEKVCLIVIDGWGLSDQDPSGNAILNAETPVMDRLCSGNNMYVEAHGRHVGLPTGLMGNSEVGHLNIGCGRVVYQDILRITIDMENEAIRKNKSFVDACNNAKAKSGRLHLLGLVSDGGVHAHIDHLFGLLKAAKALGVPKCFIQFFSDGRDTSPTSGVNYVKQVLDVIEQEKYGEIASLMGRYYAMDRDKRWERMQIAYEGLVAGEGEKCKPEELIEFMKKRYAEDITDEFMKPIILSEEGRIRDDDTMVFIDFRADRMRQIAETFGVQRHFETKTPHPKGLHISCMTQYNISFTFPLLYPPVSHKNVLAEWLSVKGLSQFHCAETEKYAHVTFFFNGGKEGEFPNEERGLVPSPKVATYDLQPEMSAAGVADRMIEEIKSGKHPFIMCNFAPPDMVGHTGVYEAAVIACAATDKAIGRMEQACKQHGYTMLVTADHGNAEKMKAEDGSKFTAHTCNKVPFCSTGSRKIAKTPADHPAALRDVAPTVLDLLGVPKPTEMDGVSLLAD